MTGGVRVRREAGSSSGKVDQDDLRRMRRHRTDTVGRSSQLTAWQRLQSESVDRHRTADTAAPAQHERITLSLGKLTGLRRESARPPADRWSPGAHGPSSFAPERPPSTGPARSFSKTNSNPRFVWPVSTIDAVIRTTSLQRKGRTKTQEASRRGQPSRRPVVRPRGAAGVDRPRTADAGSIRHAPQSERSGQESASFHRGVRAVRSDCAAVGSQLTRTRINTGRHSALNRALLASSEAAGL